MRYESKKYIYIINYVISSNQNIYIYRINMINATKEKSKQNNYNFPNFFLMYLNLYTIQCFQYFFCV